MPTYFHGLLATLGGWAHYARYTLWQAELAGECDATPSDFLAIRLLWEAALLDRYRAQIGEAWPAAITAHSMPVAPDDDQINDAILQEACERAAQRELACKLSSQDSR